MYACESGNAECVKLLLDSGASVKCVVSGYYFLFGFIPEIEVTSTCRCNWTIQCMYNTLQGKDVVG